MSNEREWRTAYWGTCADEECLTNIVIYPHNDRATDIPDQDDWEGWSLSCPVCGGSIDWGGTDHAADIIKNY